MKLIDSNNHENNAWLYEVKSLLDANNIICITKKEFKTDDLNPLIWLGTNLSQFLSKDGDTEVCPIFGKHTKNINSFTYQLCRTIPWAFEMGKNIHAIYDVILNFNTEPKNRYFIWFDAQYLFNANRKLFNDIFECLIVASYLNTNGTATHNYKVNQKVIFLFDDTNEDVLLEYLEKNYYTPSIYDGVTKNEKDRYITHEQMMLLIK